ncbi:MAG TPA: hypothetical protein VEK15_12615 [Vicinamibacteria bacterium]|nr:hypothetical protein [Vicinamibacteria bacterium]
MSPATLKRVTGATAIPVTFLTACDRIAQEQPKIRIAVAKFQHETCTICPGG